MNSFDDIFLFYITILVLGAPSKKTPVFPLIDFISFRPPRVENYVFKYAFLTCSWRFLISKKRENYNSNWKKILGFRNLQEKLENKVAAN